MVNGRNGGNGPNVTHRAIVAENHAHGLADLLCLEAMNVKETELRQLHALLSLTINHLASVLQIQVWFNSENKLMQMYCVRKYKHWLH